MKKLELLNEIKEVLNTKKDNNNEMILKNTKKLRAQHEAIRNILIDYNSVEYGDCIIDAICEVVGLQPTTIYSEEKEWTDESVKAFIQGCHLKAVRVPDFDMVGDKDYGDLPYGVCLDVYNSEGNFVENGTDWSYFATEQEADKFVKVYNQKNKK